jgi:hypothetical protein
MCACVLACVRADGWVSAYVPERGTVVLPHCLRVRAREGRERSSEHISRIQMWGKLILAGGIILIEGKYGKPTAYMF